MSHEDEDHSGSLKLPNNLFSPLSSTYWRRKNEGT